MTDDTDADALAAEFVLGTLDAEERAQAHVLLGADESFVTKVKLWERRLGELHLMVEPVEPDGKIWERIKAKMPELPPPEVKPEDAPGEAPKTETTLAGITDALAEGAAAAEDRPTAPPLGSAASAGSASAPLDALAASLAETPVAPDLSDEKRWTPSLPESAANWAPAPALPTGAPRSPLLAEAREETAAAARRLGRWRAFATLLTLLVAALAALLAAWKFAPDRVPAFLQPEALLRGAGVPSPSGAAPPPAAPRRVTPPPADQFDE